MNWLFLAVAIIAEVIATSALKASEGFTKTLPSTLVVVGYGIAFYMLSRVLSTIPVGIAYAIWSGAGIVLVSLVGLFVYKQRLDLPAMLGIGLFIAGVVVMQVFSKTSGH
jgi:small multidrug resistance pump